MTPKRTLLPYTLTIGPRRHPNDHIRDAEAFCDTYLKREFDKMGHYERDDEYNTSLHLLIIELWKLNETFDTERNDCFANYARTIIPKRAYDVSVRRILGRNGGRIHNYLYEPLDNDPQGHQPGTPHDDEPGGPDPHRGTDDPRLLAHRNSEIAWAARRLGIPTPRIAA